MFVCMCNGVTDKDIKEAISGGVITIDQLQKELDVATQCGTCFDVASDLLTQQLTAPPTNTLATYYAAA